MSISLTRRPAAALVAAAAPLLILTACSSSDDTDSSAASDTSQVQSALVVSDQWVKAVPADEHMSALFGVLTNNSDQEIRVVSGSTAVAGMVEMHETVDQGGETVMKEKAGGFAIPANGSLTLDPGGDHIMLMDLKQGIKAGETVTLDLRTGDGATVSVSAVARDFAGNQENYQP